MQYFRTASTLTASNCRWLAAVEFLIRGEHFPKITREDPFFGFFRTYYGPAAALQSTTLPPLLPALIPSPGEGRDGGVNGDNCKCNGDDDSD